MTTEVSLGIATFCFGMGIGALLTRFQWNCVKHRVTQELEGKLRGILLLERRHSVFDPPNATIRIILPDNDHLRRYLPLLSHGSNGGPKRNQVLNPSQKRRDSDTAYGLLEQIIGSSGDSRTVTQMRTGNIQTKSTIDNRTGACGARRF
jgi:hypothetical protein